MFTNDLVWDRSTSHRDRNHPPTGTLNRFPNRFGHFVCLTSCNPNTPLTVTNSDESIKRKPTTTLDDLGNTVDRYDVFDEIAPTFTPIRTTTLATTSTLTTATPTTLTASTTATSVLATLSATPSTGTTASTSTGGTTATSATTGTTTARTTRRAIALWGLLYFPLVIRH
jgi:hypothetical protein